MCAIFIIFVLIFPLGRMLCRLTPPMCLNFLGLIHLDSHVTRGFDIEETSYTKVCEDGGLVDNKDTGFVLQTYRHVKKFTIYLNGWRSDDDDVHFYSTGFH